MPTYEFICRNCGQTVSVFASMEGLKTPECLGCDQLMVRNYNFASARFKGSGFYSTDKKESDG